MSEVVLDASATLALIHNEPGQAMVKAVLADAAISTVNLSETAAKLAEENRSDTEVLADIQDLNLAVYPFTEEDGYVAGLLRRDTRRLGLSFGDRACITLALRLHLPVLTTDRIWAQLDLGVYVRVIR